VINKEKKKRKRGKAEIRKEYRFKQEKFEGGDGSIAINLTFFQGTRKLPNKKDC